MLTAKQKAVLWLSLIDGLSVTARYNIFCNLEKDIENIWQNKYQVTRELGKYLKEQQVIKSFSMLNHEYLDNYIQAIYSQGIKILTATDAQYSPLLKATDCFPLILYYKGNLDLINTPCLAVVGTRRATKYGKDITKKLVTEVAYSGVTIVSGLADGIDKVAHESALEVGGNTIVVLPSSFDNIYPSSNHALADEIAKKGLIVTEFKANDGIKPFHFVIRNRIVAGLSSATLVTEAPIKSGAMITKNYALSYNRDIFVVPFRIGDVYGAGCNQILQECQGALVLNSNDILQSFDKTNNYLKTEVQISLSENEKKIYNILLEEKTFDQLIIQSNMDTKNLNTLLTTMELKGLVKKVAGNYYRERK